MLARKMAYMTTGANRGLVTFQNQYLLANQTCHAVFIEANKLSICATY